MATAAQHHNGVRLGSMVSGPTLPGPFHQAPEHLGHKTRTEQPQHHNRQQHGATAPPDQPQQQQQQRQPKGQHQQGQQLGEQKADHRTRQHQRQINRPLIRGTDQWKFHNPAAFFPQAFPRGGETNTASAGDWPGIPWNPAFPLTDGRARPARSKQNKSENRKRQSLQGISGERPMHGPPAGAF